MSYALGHFLFRRKPLGYESNHLTASQGFFLLIAGQFDRSFTPFGQSERMLDQVCLLPEAGEGGVNGVKSHGSRHRSTTDGGAF